MDDFQAEAKTKERRNDLIAKIRNNYQVMYLRTLRRIESRDRYRQR